MESGPLMLQRRDAASARGLPPKNSSKSIVLIDEAGG